MKRHTLLLSMALLVTAFIVSGCKKGGKDKSSDSKKKPTMEAMAKPMKPMTVKRERPRPKPTKVAQGQQLIQLKGAPIASVNTTRPEAKKWDKPKYKYKNLAAVKKAGKKAVGKTVLIKGYVKSVMSPALLAECKPKNDKTIPLIVTYDAKLRDALRGVGQYCQCKTKPARILVKITNDEAVRDSFPFYKHKKPIVGEIVAIYDVQPDPPPAKLPKGVDFVSFDDILFAGKAAIGKIADLGIHREHNTPTVDGKKQYTLNANGCNPHQSVNPEIRVFETKQTKAWLAKLPKNNGAKCQRVRIKIVKGPERNYSNIYRAVIVGVGDTYDKPKKYPCP